MRTSTTIPLIALTFICTPFLPIAHAEDGRPAEPAGFLEPQQPSEVFDTGRAGDGAGDRRSPAWKPGRG